jgi:hypothetical protein
MKVSAARKKSFVEALVRGAAPEGAARSIGVDRATAFRWKDADATFAEQWDEARDRRVEAVETVLYRMAMQQDFSAVIFFLKSHRPEICNRRQVVAISGDPDNPIGVHHSGEVRSNINFYIPTSGHDKPERDEVPNVIEGAAEGEETA